MASITSYVPIKELTNEALFIVADTSEETFPTRSITATRFANYVALQIEGGVATGLENLNAPYDLDTATWRLIGRDKAYYLTPGIGNVDFSYNDDQLEGVFGLTGNSSVAFGAYQNSDADSSYLYGQVQTVKKGVFAYGCYITGNNNTLNDYHYEMIVGGYLNTVSTVGNNGSGGIMYYGAVIGAYNSMPSGRASFMFGSGLLGESAYTTIVGAANVDLTVRRASSYYAFDWNRNNPAFIVGVGDVNLDAGPENPTFVRRNGFVVIRTGDANFPELSTTMIDAAIPRSAVTKEWVESKIPASPVLSVKVSLTASQIKSLGTTPIDAIAAPGAGKYIRVTDCDGWLTWGSVAFDDNPITLTAVGAGDVQALDDYSLLAKTSTTNNRFGVYETVDPYVENAKLQVTGTDSVLTGDSTVDIYISYQIITL